MEWLEKWTSIGNSANKRAPKAKNKKIQQKHSNLKVK